MILAGDIGGTKTAVALFDETGGSLRLVRDRTFKSQDHPSLESILAEFLKDGPAASLRAGCFGVAGAVIAGRSQATNLPWILEEAGLAREIGAPRVKLLNDLEAAAYGMLHLRPEEMQVLNAGSSPRRQGNVAVIAAGTGLGEAMLFWDGSRHHPIASEGGHADFAPRTDQEIELLRYLRSKFGGHVSYERVLSGPGFFNVYTFLRDTGQYKEPASLAERVSGSEPNAAIAELGLRGEEPLCSATLDLFCAVYGAEAANLALKCLAVGGVFVGGGIAPKILEAMAKGGFMKAFMDKGRFGVLMESLPVSVALNPRAPLIGAANYGHRFV